MSTSTGISVSGYSRLLRKNTEFRRLWLAQLISGTGDWFYSVAIYSLLLQLTGSAKTVALAAVLQILPMFVAGPTAGAVNDRVSRRKVMLATDVVRALLVLGMVVVHTREQIWILYVLLAMEVAAAAFFEAARNAVLPSVVDESDIATANALSSTTWSVTVTAGAAIGGFAVVFLGREMVFLMNSASFLLSAYFIRATTIHEPHLEQHGKVRWREILGFEPIIEGFRYVSRDARLVSLLTLKFGLGILGARIILVTIIGSEEFAVQGQAALGMSLLFMFQGLGSIIGPLLAGPRVGESRSRMRWLVLAGYLAVSVSYMLFSQAKNLPLAGLTMVAAHAGASLVWVFSTTLLHMSTDDRFRGRVFAADLALFMVTASVSAYSAGWAIDHGITARATALGVGLAMLLPALAWTLSLRSLWRERRGERPEEGGGCPRPDGGRPH